MKRTSRFILLACILLLVLSATVLVGCKNKKLTSPRDLNIQDNKFVWNKVSGADGYMIYFNDNDSKRFFTWENSLDIDNENIQSSLISGKTNQMWVRAITLNKYGEPDVLSDRSRLDFDYIRQLQQPRRPRDNGNGTFSWSRVDGATKYVALVATQGSSETTEYEMEFEQTAMAMVGTIKGLPQGTYTVSIVAVSDGYLNSEASTSFTFVQTESTQPGGDDNQGGGGQGGGNQGGLDEETEWTVTFDLNYDGAESITGKAEDGGTVARPADPKRAGYTFKGWYYDKYTLVEAEFTSKISKFDVTSNMTLYAKWEQEKVTTTSVYMYNKDWSAAYVKAYDADGEPLFEGNGVAMRAVSGKAGWYTASINDKAASVVFTDGTTELSETQFNKTLPYFKDGVWTATMPNDGSSGDDPEPEPDAYATITVNRTDGTSKTYAMEENPHTPGEYMYIGLELHVGDKVVIKLDGITKRNYNTKCGFNGTAKADGLHDFYVGGIEGIWVNAPVANPFTIYYYNVNSWSQVGIHLWGGIDDDTKWPGVQMEAVVGKAGWCSIKVSADSGYTKLLFNNYTANDAEKQQTMNLQMPAGVQAGDEIFFNGYEWTDDFNVYVAKDITVYFYNYGSWDNTISAYAWIEGGAKNAAWPGVRMTSVPGKTGWYSITVSTAYNQIIFNEGKEGGRQTANLAMPADENVYFNGYEWTDDFTTYSGSKTRTIYYYDKWWDSVGPWTDVSCYAYSGSGADNNGAWPGQLMQAVAGQNGWYKLEISLDYTTVVFNDGNKGNQTGNISISGTELVMYFDYDGVTAAPAWAS